MGLLVCSLFGIYAYIGSRIADKKKLDEQEAILAVLFWGPEFLIKHVLLSPFTAADRVANGIEGLLDKRRLLKAARACADAGLVDEHRSVLEKLEALDRRRKEIESHPDFPKLLEMRSRL